MKGSEWSNYFQNLEPQYKEKIRQALVTLNNDPVFKREFGNSFYELQAIIQFPFEKEKAGN